MVAFPNYQPEISGSRETDTKASRTAFGDGYSQRIGRAVNGPDETLPFTFKLPKADIDTIATFLEDHNGVESFDFTTPEGPVIKATADKWVRSYGVTYDMITVSIVREYDPA